MIGDMRSLNRSKRQVAYRCTPYQTEEISDLCQTLGLGLGVLAGAPRTKSQHDTATLEPGGAEIVSFRLHSYVY